MTALDLAGDPVALTAALVDIASVSGEEAALADLVYAALGQVAELAVERDGNTIVARTSRGLSTRVVLAGHLDTVPLADNLPSRRVGERLYGCGSSDMKSGVAVLLHLAATVGADLTSDVTFLAYDCEEVEAARNGLVRVARDHLDWLDGDLAVLLEPTSGVVEAGCQGTLRAEVRVAGRRAHSARSWLGTNAIHAAAPLLTALASYQPRSVDIDGCTFREGLNAVAVRAGVAGNVIPDECTVTVNFRFAPDRSEEEALAHVRELLAGWDVVVVDSASGALPGLGSPAAQRFLRAVGAPPQAKLGWTDVARFAALGMPALNYGPGDPNVAHTRDEYVEVAPITATAAVLRAVLTEPR